MTIRRSLEMSLSREEFFRLLPSAVGSHHVGKDGVVSGSDGPRCWTIHLLPLSDGRLGRVALPRHQIEISFDGHTDEEVETFMARFHRGFQRGGG